MLALRKPSAEMLREFLAGQAKLDLTYSAVGATATVPPAGYVVDLTRIKLGEGGEVFAAARASLERWEHFRLGWVEAWPPETPVKVGQVVAVVARFFGLWWLNGCRIVYLVNDQGPVKLYGFAYGTLPDHAESGEERFTVEWHAKDDAVWYDILAFSRPQQLLTRLGYPCVRRLQKRFARDSAAAMKKAVRPESHKSDPGIAIA
ncbi:MAG TPA: DUF1990 domain-containing protein [Gemmataceae bacterium]|jgi:uncharacterized protein (UPF0548 family)|nr:DUF1990 domain-containing protein [Gemmataceae bacterium]